MKRITTSKIMRLAAVACCLCAIPIPATCAAFQARWNELASLVAGQEVVIPLPGGTVVSGEVVSVRADSLALDVHKVSGDRAHYKGLVSIPRAQVTRLRATKTRGAWGRRMGMFVGQLAGALGGGEFVLHVASTESSAVPSFFAIDVGATTAGYFIGKAHDKHTVEIEMLPATPEEISREEARAAAGEPKSLDGFNGR